MTVQVSFYIMAAENQRDRYACRVIEQGYLKGQRIAVRAQDGSHARQLDDLLWTFRGGSFVPHEIVTSDRPTDSPVLIFCGETAGEADLLVNLADNTPDISNRYLNVAEIVDGDSDSKVRGRERYRTYRERGYSLQTQNVDPADVTIRE